jgi:F-type H+-transporting ATPase subunit c
MGTLAAGLGIGMAAIGVSFSLSLAYQKTLDSITRQPDLLGTFRGMMFLGFAFIEAVMLLAFIIAYLLINSNA